MDSLDVYNMFFGPSEGGSLNLLDHQGDTNVRWRLDCVNDERCTPAKFWAYMEWSGSNHASQYVRLKTSEVRGFLKAKHPFIDTESEIKMVVTENLQRLIRDLK